MINLKKQNKIGGLEAQEGGLQGNQAEHCRLCEESKI